MNLRAAVQLIARDPAETGARRRLDAVLRRAVGYDFAAFSTVDPATRLWTSCYVSGLDAAGSPERERTLFELELAGDVNAFAALADRDVPAAALHATTGGVLSRARRWAPLLEGLGVVDEFRAVLRINADVWGTLVLYRAGTSRPFVADDLATVTGTLPDIAKLSRRTVLRDALARFEHLPSPPGGFTVSPDGSLTDVSAAAQVWLDALDDRRRIPSAIRCVVAAARTRPHGAVVSIPSPLGGFVTLYGSAIDASDKVSVIIEPSRDAVLNDMWAHAYRLTARERQVAQEVAIGKSTRDIARTLRISAFTVTDHLKALYTKAGVTSRSELIAALNTRHDTRRTLPGAGLRQIEQLDQYIAAGRTA